VLVLFVVLVAADRARLELARVARRVELDDEALQWRSQLGASSIDVNNIERVSVRGMYSVIHTGRRRVMVPIGPGWSAVLAVLRSKLPGVPIRMPHERPVLRRPRP